MGKDGSAASWAEMLLLGGLSFQMLLWLRQVHERAVMGRSQVKLGSYDAVFSGDADEVGAGCAAATNAQDDAQSVPPSKANATTKAT